MIDGQTIVLDVGKTHSKVSQFDARAREFEREIRRNASPLVAGHRALDVDGIGQWLIESLTLCARQGPIKRIIPVAHGAAAALIHEGRLLSAPIDYEQPVSPTQREAYATQRDPFSASGSPLLPNGLNLGMQLDRHESLHGPLPADVEIVPWPQFWAWRLSGVAASEVTSLGCHSDLWRPIDSRYTDLAERRGWAERMAPLRRAGDVLGTITETFAEETGLPRDCEVLCGLHDSNAALLAARGHAEIEGPEATVLSTGTWFVAMRTPGDAAGFPAAALPEHRDCLINVDVDGRPIPSARFMGGRDAELIRGADWDETHASEPAETLLPRLRELVSDNTCPYPSLVPGVGPYPDAEGTLNDLPNDPRDRHIVGSLYLALMTDAVLDLIGSTDRLLIEGRFADDALYVRLLATLRPDQQIYAGGAGSDLAYGALRLVSPELPPPAKLQTVDSLAVDLREFAENWRRHAGGASRVSGQSRLSI